MVDFETSKNISNFNPNRWFRGISKLWTSLKRSAVTEEKDIILNQSKFA